MITTIRTTVFSLLLCSVFALSAAASPIYSSNGIGSAVPDENGWVKAMGGAGVANADGVNSMLRNPALLSAFSRYTFSFGVNHDRNTTYSGGAEAPDFAQTDVDHFRLVLPLYKRFVLGWTVAPLTRTDSMILFTDSQYRDEVSFSGGINVSSVSAATSFGDFLRLGFSMNYHFGMIEQEWIRYFSEDSSYLDAEDFVKSKYKGYGYAAGAVVKVMQDTHVGIGYVSKVNLDHSLKITPGDFQNPEQLLYSNTLHLPSRLTFGVSRKFGRFTACADYLMEGWADAASTTTEKAMYDDVGRFSIGLKYTPVVPYGIPVPLYRRIPLSIGFKTGNMYYKSYPKIDTVTETAVTFGFAIPFIEDAASLVTSFEVGNRGDKGKNGWEESYIGIGFLLTGMIK